MSLSAKVFLVIFVCVAAVMFVGMLAYIEGHNSAATVTISNVSSAYYDTQSVANQSINQSMTYGQTFVKANVPFPMLIALFALFAGITAFILVAKKR